MIKLRPGQMFVLPSGHLVELVSLRGLDAVCRYPRTGNSADLVLRQSWLVKQKLFNRGLLRRTK